MSSQILHTSPNWIFLSFTHGAFGHLLGRCLMTSPDVTWYDNPINGDNPWSWNHFPTWSGWGTGVSHYLRFFKGDHERMMSHRKTIPSIRQRDQ